MVTLRNRSRQREAKGLKTRVMFHKTAPTLPHLFAVLCGVLLFPSFSVAAQFRGSLNFGSGESDRQSDRFTESLDKAPFGANIPTARLSLRADFRPFSNFDTIVVVDADSQRSGVVDLQEAFIGWNPVPSSPWRTRMKLGAFFPTTNLELNQDSIGWNAARSLSSSAINSWISEEIRVAGVELTQQWRGALVNSPHTFTAKAGVFGGNDPAGSEIAWRGWNVGGRVTGLFQNLRLPDLPVYRPDGMLENQSRNVHLFRELDGRAGFYGALAYAREDWLDITAMHYDNRGDPLRLKNGQYSWRTRFDHLTLRLKLADNWTLLSQYMQGDTLMGPNAVNVDFASWYVLASRELGPGIATIRHDQFTTKDRDILPMDANGERGRSWSLAYNLPLRESLLLVAEALGVRSTREARRLIGEAPTQTERSLALEMRWKF
jgi:hypothetical protein